MQVYSAQSYSVPAMTARAVIVRVTLVTQEGEAPEP